MCLPLHSTAQRNWRDWGALQTPGIGGRESGLFPVSSHRTNAGCVDRMVWKPEQGLYYSCRLELCCFCGGNTRHLPGNGKTEPAALWEQRESRMWLPLRRSMFVKLRALHETLLSFLIPLLPLLAPSLGLAAVLQPRGFRAAPGAGTCFHPN